MPVEVRSLKLQGFRAYLQPKTFSFQQQRCLAVFAPNAKGKSSIADALEFLISTNGTLKRLGQRTINNQAGPAALPHRLAEERGIESLAEITFRTGQDTTTVSRLAVSQDRSRPSELDNVVAAFQVDPIVRGHTLRVFVEEETAEKRYEHVAGWLQLVPLVDVQRNLRALRSQVKAAAEDETEFRRIDRELSRVTGTVLNAWNRDQVVEHINLTMLVPLDAELSLQTLSADDETVAVIRDRAKEEENQLGLSTCRQALSSLTRIYSETKPELDDGEIQQSGALIEFIIAVETLAAAVAAETAERDSAANSIFSSVWQEAEPLFADEESAPSECPICTTPISETRAGSAESIKLHLQTSRATLASYAEAKKKLDVAQQSVRNKRQGLVTQLQNLPAWLTDSDPVLKTAADAFATELDALREGLPDAVDLIEALIGASTKLQSTIADIEQRQGDHTYAKAIKAIDDLIELEVKHELLTRTAAELAGLHESLVAQATYIVGHIREHVQQLLDELRTEMNELYGLIQGEEAVPVRLELPHEDDTNQQRLNLLIDFAPNRLAVQPSGYLSDSQIHSLALAFRLAAIRHFNSELPFVILDDIVTSYDADHRRLIASMLAQRFADHQLIITTHDERFFVYLKDQLSGSDWRFLRITSLDPEFGPKFTDHKVSDELIESRWEQGDSAANEMRQAEEEWLLSKCREFGARVQIRTPERAHNYERAELADSLAQFLRDAGLVPPLVPGVNNRFLASLQQGVVENFGSHFQDAQYGAGSEGDERARWREFVAFRELFKCPACQRTKFKRPEQLRRPICNHRGCEAQFAFPAQAVR